MRYDSVCEVIQWRGLGNYLFILVDRELPNHDTCAPVTAQISNTVTLHTA